MIHKVININKGSYIKLALFFIGIVFSLIASCSPKNNEKQQITENKKVKNNIPYDLKNPDTIYQLPKYLEEISGISFYQKNKIACVQDEQANIYIFDIEKGKVTSKFDFGKNGDYEDTAIDRMNAYVLRSDGTIFKVENFEKQLKTTKIKTSFTKKNNVEGLLFDKSSNSLLIAPKDLTSLNTNQVNKNYIAIYRFDLTNNKFIEKPAYLIDISNIDTRKVGKYSKNNYMKWLNIQKNTSGFHPSGIAFHPINENNLYVISSVEKILIVVNNDGTIIDFFQLDKQIFNQPEGICFSENGDMYISNEGKKGKATILKFIYKS